MNSLYPYALLAGAWSFYLFLHSALAADRVKKAAWQAGIGKRMYRLIYSILSTVLLFGLLVLNGATPGEYLFPKGPFSSYGAMFLATFGIFILRAVFKHYSFGSFTGLSKKPEKKKLIREGILARVRHPIYSATILISMGFVLFDPRLPTLISMMCIWIYLPAGIYLEEIKLVREYGEAYKKYREQVPAIIPGLKF